MGNEFEQIRTAIAFQVQSIDVMRLRLKEAESNAAALRDKLAKLEAEAAAAAKTYGEMVADAGVWGAGSLLSIRAAGLATYMIPLESSADTVGAVKMCRRYVATAIDRARDDMRDQCRKAIGDYLDTGRRIGAAQLLSTIDSLK